MAMVTATLAAIDVAGCPDTRLGDAVHHVLAMVPTPVMEAGDATADALRAIDHTPRPDAVQAIANLMDSAGALLTAGLLAGQVLDIPYRPDWRIPVVGIVVAVAALALIGWRVAEKILREPVVHGLRESQ